MSSTAVAGALVDDRPPPSLKRPDVLTERQHVFIREWLKHGNGSKAALAAGYSPKVARQHAAATLRLPKVQREVERLTQMRAKRLEVTATKVLDQAARMAFVDPREYVDENGNPIPVHQLSDDAAAALQGLEVELGQNGKLKTRYKLVDRGAAVDKLMRHLGMFEKDNTQAVDAVGQLLASIHTAGSRIGVKR